MGIRDGQIQKMTVNLDKYIHMLLGVKKTGKTTLFRDLILNLYYSPKYGLRLGFEPSQGMDSINNENIKDWDDFIEVLDMLIYEKDTYNIKFICIDTIDMMVYMAEQHAIAFFNRISDKKSYTINQAGGGFNRGRDYTKQLIINALDKIIKAGYGLFLIGHSKTKKIKTRDGDEYDLLTCNLTNDYSDIFLNLSDIIGFLTTDREIENGSLVKTKVKINFRSEDVDCGCRLKYVPESIDYSVENYINALEESIMKQINESELSYEDIEKEKRLEEENNSKESKKNTKKIIEEQIKVELSELKELYNKAILSKKLNKDDVLNKLKELGCDNFASLKDINSIKVIKEFLTV